MEPMLTQPFWKNQSGTWFKVFPVLEMSKKGHFLASPGTLGYIWKLEKRGIHLNIQVLQAKSGGEFLAWLSIPENF